MPGERRYEGGGDRPRRRETSRGGEVPHGHEIPGGGESPPNREDSGRGESPANRESSGGDETPPIARARVAARARGKVGLSKALTSRSRVILLRVSAKLGAAEKTRVDAGELHGEGERPCSGACSRASWRAWCSWSFLPPAGAARVSRRRPPRTRRGRSLRRSCRAVAGRYSPVIWWWPTTASSARRTFSAAPTIRRRMPRGWSVRPALTPSSASRCCLRLSSSLRLPRPFPDRKEPTARRWTRRQWRATWRRPAGTSCC